MTGFGRGTHRLDGPGGAVEAAVEVRTVNGRGSDVTVRLPRALAAHEAEIAARVRDHIGRGTATVTVTTEQAAAGGALRVDAEAARAVAETLRALRDAAGLTASEAPITLDALLRPPEGMARPLTTVAPDDAGTGADAWPAVEAALAEALAQLDAMRAVEGAALDRDLRARLATLERLAGDVEARAPLRVAEARTRLADRLAEMLGDTRLDPVRLETEIALLADRLDVSEEVVRLRSHLAQATAALDGDAPAGRRLGFLVQEILREVNTTGSKAGDTEVAHLAVAMKETVEQIREQAANVV
ncbi:MAG TPA: YicC/YloC family endoribonuclease [Rubricoccaceae bacterium]